jgi:hypothetical protein
MLRFDVFEMAHPIDVSGHSQLRVEVEIGPTGHQGWQHLYQLSIPQARALARHLLTMADVLTPQAKQQCPRCLLPYPWANISEGRDNVAFERLPAKAKRGRA